MQVYHHALFNFDRTATHWVLKKHVRGLDTFTAECAVAIQVQDDERHVPDRHSDPLSF